MVLVAASARSIPSGCFQLQPPYREPGVTIRSCCPIVDPPLASTGDRDCCSPAENGGAMCKKCVELDDKIAHYKRISTYVTDQLTLNGIAGLIKQMQSEKSALHLAQPG
jgi:hypothetical protein